MRTVLQISAGVLLGIFVLLFCMANDEWIVIHLPRAPWNAEPSFPAFETRVFALMLACFIAGILLSLFLAYFLGVRRRRQMLERDRKISALELELQKANRLMARTAQSSDDNTKNAGGTT